MGWRFTGHADAFWDVVDSDGNGKGGESVYGGQFDDESFHYAHNEPYLLSMANGGRHMNGSQFFITTTTTPHLDTLSSICEKFDFTKFFEIHFKLRV